MWMFKPYCANKYLSVVVKSLESSIGIHSWCHSHISQLSSLSFKFVLNQSLIRNQLSLKLEEFESNVLLLGLWNSSMPLKTPRLLSSFWFCLKHLCTNDRLDSPNARHSLCTGRTTLWSANQNAYSFDSFLLKEAILTW